MKICCVTFDFPPLSIGGIATQSSDLVDYLSKKGVEVHVLTSCPDGDDHYNSGSFKVTRLKVPFASKLGKLPTFQFRVLQWLLKNSAYFDVIHFQENSGFLYLLCHIFKRAHSNTIAEFHHSHATDFISHLKSLLKTPLENLPYMLLPLSIFQQYICVLGAKHVVTVSNQSRSTLISWGIKSIKITVIPNALSELFLINSQPRFLKESSIVKFLYVGLLLPRKGVDIILEAINILTKQGYSNYNVDIVGQGPLFTYCRKYIEKNNLHNCSLKGAVSQLELHRLYRQANCLICPSRFEGFGIVLLEAGAHNLAIIANDIPVFKEIYGEDEAIYFKRNDPLDLAAKMSQLIWQPSLISNISEKAHQKVDDFVWEKIGKQYLTLYSNMIGTQVSDS